MPAKPSGEIKTRKVNVTQKNGDIYVYERQMVYEPDKKRNKTLNSKLLSKIPKGTDSPVTTRPKKKSLKESENVSDITATRSRIGMMEIIDHIGITSGIDSAIYDNTDLGTAQKLLSLARYLLASNGQTLPGILAWQFSHKLPYEDGISEGIYHDLFVKVGRDETLQQSFFENRCKGLEGKAVLAYDSTTISTYSENQIEARYGYNKDGDGLKTIKLLALYSIETRQPIAFTKQPGNLSDVTAIANALKQLSVLGIGDAEIITDNGFYSENNFYEFLAASFNFITLVKVNIKWVKPEIDIHREEFSNISSICPFDTGTHGITLTLTRDFASNCNQDNKEILTSEVYLHLYFNPARKVEEDNKFDNDLLELRNQIEEGIEIDKLPQSSQNKVKKYLIIGLNDDRIHISFNEDNCRKAKQYHGYFALVSNSEKDTFECLYKYRRRETIESFFGAMKQRVDGLKTRVWDADTLRGRMFVQFVSLCYYEYLSNDLRKIKMTLGVKTGNPDNDSEANLKLERKLKYWIEESPIYLILQWFDTVEGVNISTKLLSKRWSTEITQRDQLFLDKMGVELPY